MPMVEGFTHDLFISYAHRNNSKLADQDTGWVTEFVETLSGLLQSKSRDFKLWKDERLLPGEVYDASIEDAIRSSAIFLTIFSPAWMESTYCRRELDIFRNQRNPAFGWEVKDAERTFKRIQGVIFQDVPQDQWPPELKSTSPARFAVGEFAWLSRPRDADMSDPYFVQIAQVAESIWKTLDVMRKRKLDKTAIERTSPRVSMAAAGSGCSLVYVAHVTEDLDEKRTELRQTLTDIREFQVELAPDQQSAIERSALSVHLVNATVGRPLPQDVVSLPQLELKRAKASGLTRRPLVWLPKDVEFLKVTNAQHRELLMELQDGSVELIRSDWEDFKTEVTRRVQPPKSPTQQTLRSRRKAGPIVYVSVLEGTNGSLKQIREKLIDLDCGVFVLEMTQSSEELQRKHQKNLRTCDGFLVPYNAQTQSRAEELVMEAYDLMRTFDRPRGIAAVAVSATQEFGFHGHSVAVLEEGEDLQSFLGMLQE